MCCCIGKASQSFQLFHTNSTQPNSIIRTEKKPALLYYNKVADFLLFLYRLFQFFLARCVVVRFIFDYFQIIVLYSEMLFSTLSPNCAECFCPFWTMWSFLGVVFVWQYSIDAMYTSSLHNMLGSATPLQSNHARRHRIFLDRASDGICVNKRPASTNTILCSEAWINFERDD